MFTEVVIFRRVLNHIVQLVLAKRFVEIFPPVGLYHSHMVLEAVLRNICSERTDELTVHRPVIVECIVPEVDTGKIFFYFDPELPSNSRHEIQQHYRSVLAFALIPLAGNMNK